MLPQRYKRHEWQASASRQINKDQDRIRNCVKHPLLYGYRRALKGGYLTLTDPQVDVHAITGSRASRAVRQIFAC